jgi:hypothetical protein
LLRQEHLQFYVAEVGDAVLGRETHGGRFGASRIGYRALRHL